MTTPDNTTASTVRVTFTAVQRSAVARFDQQLGALAARRDAYLSAIMDGAPTLPADLTDWQLHFDREAVWLTPPSPPATT